MDDQGLQGVHQKRERDREAERRDQAGGEQQVAQAQRPRPGPRACRTASARRHTVNSSSTAANHSGPAGGEEAGSAVGG